MASNSAEERKGLKPVDVMKLRETVPNMLAPQGYAALEARLDRLEAKMDLLLAGLRARGSL